MNRGQSHPNFGQSFTVLPVRQFCFNNLDFGPAGPKSQILENKMLKSLPENHMVKKKNALSAAVVRVSLHPKCQYH